MDEKVDAQIKKLHQAQWEFAMNVTFLSFGLLFFRFMCSSRTQLASSGHRQVPHLC
jgi:hypothetical protein